MNEYIFTLLRYSAGEVSTLGLIRGQDDLFRCYTLEDEYREVKVAGETRIPEGKYEIKLRTEGGMNGRYAKKFDFHKGMLWLQDVPGFKWIYFHPGNKHENTKGCILTGDGSMQNLTEDGMVMSSVSAYKRLYKEIINLLQDHKVFIDIKDL